MEKERGVKKERKGKIFVVMMSDPTDAVLLLSDLHIPCSQCPGNWAQLMLAVLRVSSWVICGSRDTSSIQTGSFWGNFAFESRDWLGWLAFPDSISRF